MDSVFVPKKLFDIAGIGDPWPPHLAKARRLLVTMWVLAPDKSKAATDEDTARARWFWDVNPQGLTRAGRVTVLTVLIQLRDIDVIAGFEEVDGGYLVALAKEEVA